MSTTEWEERTNSEREKRQERGRTAPFQIDNLADDHPFFSFFRVKGASHLSYDVEIHSLLDNGRNYCTCQDYRYNALGTCKHIEAVLEQLRKASPQAFTWTLQKQPELQSALFACWIDGRERLCLTGSEALALPGASRLFPDGVLAEGLDIDAPDLLEFIPTLKSQRVLITRSAETALQRLGDESELYRKVLIRERDSLDANVLRKPLKGYQVESARFMLENRRCIISEPFGTGKRISSLAALAVIKKVRGNARVVVVTDPSYFSHWKRLIKIFYPLGVHTFGEALQRNAPDPFAVKPFFLCSYATLLRDAQKIQGLEPTLIIFDEIQSVRKWTGQTGQLLKSLHAPYTFVLASAPVLSNDETVINLAQYFFPREFGPLWKFLAQRAQRDHFGKVVQWEGLDPLRELLAGISMARPLASIAQDIPRRAKLRVVLTQNLKQRKVMGDQLTRLFALAGTRFEWSKKDLSSILSSIRELRLGLGEISHIVKENSSTPKQEYLRALLDEVAPSRPRVLLHTHFAELIEPLSTIAQAAGYSVLTVESQVQAQKLAAFDGPIVGFITDKHLDCRADGVNLVVNFDLPWSKELITERRQVSSNSATGYLTEFNLLVGGSLEERAMVVVETLPKLIGEWFDDPEDPVIEDPQALRNLIRKLAGRREERMSSSKMRKVEKSNSRERVISLKGIRDMGRPGTRGNERILSMGLPQKSLKKSIIWNGSSPLPSLAGATILLNLQTVPAGDGVEPALATLVNPANGHFMAFTPEHLTMLGEKLTECAFIVSAGTCGPVDELLREHIPGFDGQVPLLDFPGLLFKTSGEEYKFHDISEATLGKRMVWDENEIRRLYLGKRFSDLAEVGRSDLKVSWGLIGYIAREGRYYTRGSGGREEYQLRLDEMLPAEVFDLMLTRQNL